MGKLNNKQITSASAVTSISLNQKVTKGVSLNTRRTLAALVAFLLAMLIGLLLIIATGQTYAIGNFFKNFWSESFGSISKFSSWLSTLAYLIPLGLALAVSFRMGIFNIGAAGQALAGGSIAFLVGSTLNIGSLGWIVTIIIGVAVGASMAFVIAFLKNKFKINEVISSIMLNWMAFYLIRFLVIPADGDASTILINANNDLNFAWLNSLFGEGNASDDVNIGIIIMIPLAVLVWFAYSKTKWGYKQDLIGNNPHVGDFLGIDKNKEIYKAMIISGALAGFAGVVYQCGMDNAVLAKGAKDIPAWTFNGITISLLGFNSPIGIIFSSALFATFNSDIDSVIGDYGIIDVIVALMVVFIAASNYLVTYGRKGGK